CFGGTGKREVFEPDIGQELETIADLLDDLVRNGQFLASQNKRIKESECLLQRDLTDLMNIATADFHVACLASQACTTTFRTGLGIQVFRQLFPYGTRIRFVVT